MIEWLTANWGALLNVIMIDVVLAGDNAIVIGLAASRVPVAMRSKVIFWGIAAAVVLRIFFAAITVQLLAIVGLTLAGGLLLLFVCWKMYQQIAAHDEPTLDDIQSGAATAGAKQMGFWAAVAQITIADVSMSLDNVLAVAGAAKGDYYVLAIGLAVAIILMALAAHAIARVLEKYTWVTWIGLLIILYVASDMIYRGSGEVACQTYEVGCQGLWQLMMSTLNKG